MRRIIVLAIALLAAGPALAQAPPQPAPGKIITFAMTESEAQLVVNALTAMPWKDVNPLVQKLFQQANEQLKPPPASQPPPSDKP